MGALYCAHVHTYVYMCVHVRVHTSVCVSMCDYIEQYYFCHSYYLLLVLSNYGTTDSISEVYCGRISHTFHLAVENLPPEVTLTAKLCSSKWILFSFIRQTGSLQKRWGFCKHGERSEDKWGRSKMKFPHFKVSWSSCRL